MLERTKNDTTGNIGNGQYLNGSNGKITLNDVYEKFKQYNFIINTKSITIDTSRFYGIARVSANLFNGSTIQPAGLQTILNNVNTGIVLYQVKNPDKVGGETEEKDFSEIICLPELDDSNKPYNYEIQVKSVRNFLENQKTTAKEIRQLP